MSIKRKPRNKMQKKVDLLKPIDITSFGSEDDPCFGKFYDPRAEECSRCGDSELCAIKFSQLNATQRAKLEASQTFKDIDEKNIPAPDKKTIRKSIKNRIREMIKMGGKDGVKEAIVINDVYASYGKDGFTPAGIKKILKKVVETSTKISYNDKQRLIWQ